MHRLPGDHSDDHSRVIEARGPTAKGALRVHQHCRTARPKPTNPLQNRMYDTAFGLRDERLSLGEPLILAGDYNVSPARATSQSANWRVTRVPVRAPAGLHSLLTLG